MRTQVGTSPSNASLKYMRQRINQRADIEPPDSHALLASSVGHRKPGLYIGLGTGRCALPLANWA